MEKSRVKIELAEENYGNQDPLAKENTIGTTPNTDILMSTPSIRQMKLTENNVIKTNYRLQESLGVSTDRSILLDSSVLNDFNFEPLDTHHQLEEFDEKLGRDAAFADKMVCLLTNNYAASNMCIDEIEMEEIKREPSADSDPIWQASSEKITTDTIDKVEESSQSEPSFSAIASHNENRYRRQRCNYCSLLFYSDKTLTNHQKKCQQVYEKLNAAPKMPIAKNEEVGSCSRPENVAAELQPQDFKGACTSPVAKVIANLQAETVPLVSNGDSDPLACDLPPLVPITISSPVLRDSLKNETVMQYPTSLEITVQLEQLKNAVTKLRSENSQLHESLGVPTDRPILMDRSVLNDFDFEPLDTRNQLEEFDENLGRDAAFADKMGCWLSSETGDCSPKTSIARSIDLLFSRQLFANCSWAGMGQKIPFSKFKNIHKLLRRLSSVKGCKEPTDITRSMLQKRLKQAKARLQINPGRKTFCKNKSRIRSPSNDASHFEVATIIDGTKDSPANQSNTDTSNTDVFTERPILLDRSVLIDFDFEPLDTRNQLEEFDENLGKDTSFADKMCCWLSSETGVCCPKTSVALSLDLLFSRQLFASCSWSGDSRKGPKIPFCKFENIHKLLHRLASAKGCKEAADMTEAMLRKRLNNAKARLQFNPGRKTFCKNKSRIKSPSNDGMYALLQNFHPFYFCF
ncbi:uncharacterized protein LOC131285691 [Anopheles ziemanni]|uniref:uncharacterized protein LOC131285691 n=1 Tax=Anopheles ziemanni TaxID=345580 RepID=UPI0026602C71|nr:uncharacterized protein LOC131285691 [Anopheles ziemanni]